MRRIREVDAIRGLALCGIVFANIVGITGMPVESADGYQAYETLLHGRFFPIFSFLFGLSAALFLRSAAERTDSPRLVLMARLGFLTPVGLAHQFLQPGEVLLPYAVIGLIVLLPASFAPRWAVLGCGGVATAAALGHGGWTLVPGLFLLGMAAAEYGLAEELPRPWLAFAVSAGAAVVLDLGVVTAAAYVTGLVALLRTPARKVLLMVLEPLGRTALTNYLSATLLIIAADKMLGLGETSNLGLVVGVGLAISGVQAGFCVLWLRRFRSGPVEWVWRCATWWEPVPNRRQLLRDSIL